MQDKHDYEDIQDSMLAQKIASLTVELFLVSVQFHQYPPCRIRLARVRRDLPLLSDANPCARGSYLFSDAVAPHPSQGRVVLFCYILCRNRRCVFGSVTTLRFV
jgi:hypothetical protein